MRWIFFLPLAIALCGLLEWLVGYVFGLQPLPGSRMAAPSQLLGTHLRKLVSAWALVALPAIAVKPHRPVALLLFWLGASLSVIPIAYDLYRGTLLEVLYAIGAAGVDLLGGVAGLATVWAYIRAVARQEKSAVVAP